MSVTPFMHPAFGALLGNEQVADLLSAEKEMGFMLAFERELAAAQAELDIIPAKAAEEIARVTESFEPDWQALASKTAQDGVVVPELVRQLREELSAENRNFLHFGATSQDVMDTALVLQFQSVFNQFDADLAGLLGRLTDLQNRFGDQKMMAQTRMQRALPISVGQKLATWTAPLFTLKEELFDLEKRSVNCNLAGPLDHWRSLPIRPVCSRKCWRKNCHCILQMLVGIRTGFPFQVLQTGCPRFQLQTGK